MSQLAKAKFETTTAVSATVMMPAVLAVNTVALFAFDQFYGIPRWIKLAATFFLAF
jgi:hypothetical protein